MTLEAYEISLNSHDYGFEEPCSCIVVAENEKEAKQMARQNQEEVGYDPDCKWIITDLLVLNAKKCKIDLNEKRVITSQSP